MGQLVRSLSTFNMKGETMGSLKELLLGVYLFLFAIVVIFGPGILVFYVAVFFGESRDNAIGGAVMIEIFYICILASLFSGPSGPLTEDRR